MSNNKSQISPIPPEGYGDRFVKFISGLTMTKEEQERATESGEQLNGSIDTARRTSFPISRKSNETKVVEQAEIQAHKTEREGSSEESHRDRTLSAVRSPSAERSAGITGATLPVVEEDGEAGSREDSVQDEKGGPPLPNGSAVQNEHPPLILTKVGQPPPNDHLSNDAQLPSIPNFNRLSMGLQSPAVER